MLETFYDGIFYSVLICRRLYKFNISLHSLFLFFPAPSSIYLEHTLRTESSEIYTLSFLIDFAIFIVNLVDFYGNINRVDLIRNHNMIRRVLGVLAVVLLSA